MVKQKVDAKNIDIIVHSYEIKKLVLSRIKENNISIRRLLVISGVDINDFKAWMNTNDPKRIRISQYNIMVLLRLLGCNLRVQVVADQYPISNILRNNVRFNQSESDSAKQDSEAVTERFSNITGFDVSPHRINHAAFRYAARNNGGRNKETANPGHEIPVEEAENI